MHIKKLFQLLLIQAVATAAYGQVIINPQIPAMGLVLKSQLWSISIINTGNPSLQAQVQMTVTDASNNQPVFSGTTRTLTLPKGLTQLNANDAAPVIYNVLGAGYGVDNSPDGFLPVGIFTICYSVNLQNQEGSETVAQECENVEISPISPPTLILPLDSDAVDVTRPLFSWLPPAPYNLFSNLTYTFTLVEVLPMQDAPQAIQQNIPLQLQSNLYTTNYQYPVSLPELDTAKLYAWQITANNGYSPISKSEVWLLKIRKPGADTSSHVLGDYYVRASQSIDGGFAICKGVLRFAYYNEINEDFVNINLYDISTSQKDLVQMDSTYMHVGIGQNYSQLDFTSGPNLIAGHLYLLDLINSKNEHWYVKFDYKKPD